MDESLKNELKKQLEAKKAYRHELARLPYPEKIRMVVEMQKRAAPILAARGIKVHIWEIDQ